MPLFGFEVALVAHNDQWDPVRTLRYGSACGDKQRKDPVGTAYQMIEDLIPQDADHLEGLPGSDGVDEHVAMDADKVLGVEDAVFVLSSRVRWADRCSKPFRDDVAGLKRLPDPPCRLSRSQNPDLCA